MVVHFSSGLNSVKKKPLLTQSTRQPKHNTALTQALQTDVVQFGWTAKALQENPDSYKLQLSKKDILWTKRTSPYRLLLEGAPEIFSLDPSSGKLNEKHTPRLTPAKINEIIQRLCRKDYNGAGFVVLEDLDQYFKTPQAWNTFFRQLMVDIGYVVNNHPDYRQYFKIGQEGNPHLVVSGLKYMTDGSTKNGVQGKDVPLYTHKEPHFDNGPVIGGLFHLPVQGIEGGLPQIFDIEDYIASHPNLGFPPIIKITRGELEADHDKEEINPAVLKQPDFVDYTLTLDRNPDKPILVLFNNKGAGRIAHGATPLEIQDPHNFSRDLLRYTCRPWEDSYKTNDNPTFHQEYPPQKRLKEKPWTGWINRAVFPLSSTRQKPNCQSATKVTTKRS